MKKMLMRLFLANEEGWGVTVIQECRLQVAKNRFAYRIRWLSAPGKKSTGLFSIRP
jgi:hypothetical protein